MSTKGTILIVDDEKEIIEILQEQLTQKGYTVHIAISGKDAINILNKEPVEILLTDIRMPGMGGIELMNIAKKEHPDLQCIVITGQGNYELAIEAMLAGAINFLRKPAQMDVDVIDAALKNGMKVVKYLQEIKDKNDELLRLNDELNKANKKLEELLKASEEECITTKARLLMRLAWYYYKMLYPNRNYCDFCEEINEEFNDNIWTVSRDDDGNCVAKTFVRYINKEPKKYYLVIITAQFTLKLMKNNENRFSEDDITELEKSLKEFEDIIKTGKN
jgi:FixJ family two-component response regulator